MNTATLARHPNGKNVDEWTLVPLKDDTQLQSLLKVGWIIQREEQRKVHLFKETNRGRRTMVHNRRRA